MLSPEFQYIIYKEREKSLEREIARRLEAQESGRLLPSAQPWYAVVAQWLKVKAFRRAQEKPQFIKTDTSCADCPY